MGLLDRAVLTALRSSTVHLPIGDLAKGLRADAAAVSASVASLREAGFEIEDRPGLGFRMISAPDRLIADDLYARLGHPNLFRDVIVLEETDSTNQRGIDLGKSGVAGPVAIFAERQTRGRGRFGRRWESASHLGLWFSLLLRPNLPLAAWSRLTTWIAVATAEAVEAAAGIPLQIKWPNDLEHQAAKVAGILIEILQDESRGYFAVVGVGMNVNHGAEDFPEELRGRATSLRLIGGTIHDRTEIAAQVLRSVEHTFSSLDDTGFAQVLEKATQRSSLRGKRVVIESAATRIEGIAESLASDGRLVLRLNDGSSAIVSAGEATVAGRESV